VNPQRIVNLERLRKPVQPAPGSLEALELRVMQNATQRAANRVVDDRE